MSDAILHAEAIHKSYPMGRAELEVLRGCELHVQPGEFVAIMGRSGSGKSTLLHILGALDVPQRGEVYFRGARTCHPATRFKRVTAKLDRVCRVLGAIIKAFVLYVALPVFLGSLALLLLLGLGYLVLSAAGKLFPYWLVLFQVASALAGVGLATLIVGLMLLLLRLILVDIVDWQRIRLRKRAFGFVFQFYHLLPELNVLENVLLPRMVAAYTLTWLGARRAARNDTLAILGRVGLKERLTHKPSELSGGERQRVAIARALVHKPQVLFADEPTGNLDAEAGQNIMSILTRLHAEGQTIVMVTHDPSIAEYADRVLLLEDGRLRSA
jgi:ABC-type lipoprotein export system ATPase subunit